MIVLLEDIVAVAGEFDRRAKDLRASAGPGTPIDTKSHLAASIRGRAKSYGDAATTLRARFKIPQQGGVDVPVRTGPEDLPGSYEDVIAMAKADAMFAAGLAAAAVICRAQGIEGTPCPSDMAAVYLDRLAKGEMP